MKPPKKIPTMRELNDLAKHYAGRPSPLYFAPRLTEHFANLSTTWRWRENLFQAR